MIDTKRCAVLTSAFLAPIEYYAKLFHYDNIVIEASDNYVKQTYRNRCFIGAANDRLPLSIPVIKNESEKCQTKDIRISDHGNWRHQHWYAIESTYNNSPFFEYYEDEIKPFFQKEYDNLFEYNEELRKLICSLIGFTPKVTYSKEYFSKDEIEGGDIKMKECYFDDSSVNIKCTDFREIIHPKKNYILLDPEFGDIPYYQLFDQRWGFRPNLSIIDLLFNMGPESILILRDSIKGII